VLQARSGFTPNQEGFRPPARWSNSPASPPLSNLTQPCAEDMLGHMDAATKPSRKIVTAQNMDEAKTAAYANDPQTELVILGLTENPALTTCGWARQFFDTTPSGC